MSKKNKKQTKKVEQRAIDPLYGTIYSQWKFPEFTTYERSNRWYFIAAAISVLMLVYAIISANYLFAVSVVIIDIIIMLQHRRAPLPLTFSIMHKGISFDEKFFDWRELDNFWIVYEPPEIKKLYIGRKSSWRPEFSISLEDQNPIVIRDIMLKFLREDLEKETETPSDSFSRRFKI